MPKLSEKNKIKKYLKEARSKGWWIECFYWERKLEQEELKEKAIANTKRRL